MIADSGSADGRGDVPPIVVNTRVLLNPLTGVQRYTRELLPRLGDLVEPARPGRRMTSALNQAWEQVVLPRRSRGRLLWSPANTGPVSVENQVLTLHDVAPLDHPEWYRSQFARYAGWLLPRLVARVRHVITGSRFSRDRIVATTGVSPDKITVIPIAAPSRFVPPPGEQVEEACRRYGLDPRNYVLHLGSIEPRKNLGRLLEAWRACQPRLPEGLVLAVAGDRANPRAFRSTRLPDPGSGVRWLGRIGDEDLPVLMAGAVLCVYVSLYEGFGLPPLEAMSVGTPVVTSGTTSIPEVVEDAAITVDPADVASIAEGLERALGDPALRARLRRAGLDRARNFDYDVAAARTREVLLANL